MCTSPIFCLPLKPGEKAKFLRINSLEDYLRTANDPYRYLGNCSIPCRKCLDCRMRYAKEWAVRISLHTKDYPNNNWFLTLTYSDKFLPLNEAGIPTLDYSHLTLFLKKLRAAVNYVDGCKLKKGDPGYVTFKYFAAGEYGSRFRRPHFHLIMLGLPLKDAEPYKSNKLGQMTYISKIIDELWGFGFHTLGTVTYESSGYVARYCMKKASKLDYEKLGIEPEKSRVSKGLGKPYFEDHWEDIYKYGKVYFKTDKGLQSVNPPQYYDRLMKKYDPVGLEFVKKYRSVWAKNNLDNRLTQLDRTYVEDLEVRRLYNHERVKSLKRNLKHVD